MKVRNDSFHKRHFLLELNYQGHAHTNSHSRSELGTCTGLWWYRYYREVGLIYFRREDANSFDQFPRRVITSWISTRYGTLRRPDGEIETIVRDGQYGYRCGGV